MSDAGSPTRPRPLRISTLKDFLPLNEESPYSTRGQTLPSLVQNRSYTNIAGLRNVAWNRRRRSSLDEDLPRKGQEPERGRDREREPDRRYSFMPGYYTESDDPEHDRRMSLAASVLMTPQMRSQRLIGNSNPRYRWEQYWKTEDQLKKMPKKIREYYERCNYLIQRYMYYIDRLLDSSLPRDLIEEYQHANAAPDVPPTISEESSGMSSPDVRMEACSPLAANGTTSKLKRTPKELYKVRQEEPVTERTPLMRVNTRGDEEAQVMPPDLEPEEEADSQSPIVTIAIIVNTVANTILLVMKSIVTVLTSSVSVLASLVDAALDWLSTLIIWSTNYFIAHTDQYAYPIGRRRLEPVGIMVFAVIMITSFAQVAIEGIQKLSGPDHSVVQLTTSAIIIMASTVGIKGACWLWCRLIPNSSVQALAQDAITDVVFNTFSIIFPLIGYYAQIWWLDPLGGIVLSCWVIFQWSTICSGHIRKLTGCAATADERNVLLYLTMRFAKTIKKIQGLQAYHAGDKLNVEVDIVLDENTSLRDSHDLGESLQYVLESHPSVDRAFVHLDYASYNLPTHMTQDS